MKFNINEVYININIVSGIYSSSMKRSHTRLSLSLSLTLSFLRSKYQPLARGCRFRARGLMRYRVLRRGARPLAISGESAPLHPVHLVPDVSCQQQRKSSFTRLQFSLRETDHDFAWYC